MADLSVLGGTPRIKGGKTQLLITFSFRSKLRQRRARQAGRDWSISASIFAESLVNVKTLKNSHMMGKCE